MKIIHNIGTIDRGVRFVLAEIFFLGAFFWTYGWLQILLFVVAGVMLITASFRFCGLYTVFGIHTCPLENQHKKSVSIQGSVLMSILFVGLLIAGAYGSIFFTKKFFLEDFSSMNQYYKQTLFFTGQNKREEAVSNYNNLVMSYDGFYAKYSVYQPYILASDKNFVTDITTVKNTITSLHDMVMTGDLPATHKEFEAVRPVFQDILKRNGFSLLTVYLVDFHDAMEKVIDAANAKNKEGVLGAYPEVDEKLKAVETITNDEEVQMIRQKLEQVRTSAQSGSVEVLPSQAAELKSSFVKVYLKRG